MKCRDFKINALYYSIKDHVLIDKLNSIDDLRNKVISLCNTPEFVF